MSAYVPSDLKAQIRQVDRRRCCYCLTTEDNSGIPMSFEHIYPRSKGGVTAFQNLCLACRPCNEFKGDTTEGKDDRTGETVPLFNPRTQVWSEHFAWSQDGTQLEGLTPVGRVTVIMLRINHAAIVRARRRWVLGGWHPPTD